MIRKAIINDIDAIKALWDHSIKDAFAQQKPDKDHNPEGELVFKMKQLSKAFKKKTSHYFVAFKEDQLIGTIAYGTPPNIGILSRTKGKLVDSIEIGSLYIDPRYQKQGYGKRLLIYILEYIQNLGIDVVCFDSIIESSKQIWIRLFGEPEYKLSSKKDDFTYMIWVVNVQESLENFRKISL